MAFKNPPRSITWPPGARTNEARIVVGSDTPDELEDLFNIAAAILFYAIDEASGLERGYFFIAITNDDTVAIDEPTLMFGEVQYPVMGQPSSATVANVKTNLVNIMMDNLVPLARIFNLHVSDIGGLFFQQGARFGSIDGTFGTSDVDVVDIDQDVDGGVFRLSPDSLLEIPSTSRGLTGSGLILPETIAFKTAEPSVNNSAVLIDDPELFLAFPVPGEYMVEGVIFFSTPVGANFQYTFRDDDAANGEFRWISNSAAPTMQMFFDTQVQNVARTNTFQGFRIDGRYRNSVNGGGITFQWAQQTATVGNTFILRGSRLSYRRVS